MRIEEIYSVSSLKMPKISALAERILFAALTLVFLLKWNHDLLEN